jgi:hypothetical protein
MSELLVAYSMGSMDSAGSGARIASMGSGYMFVPSIGSGYMLVPSIGSGYMFVPSIGSASMEDSIGSRAMFRKVVCCTDSDHIVSIA